jgi:DNA-binding NarL/FixJ family response regulator
MSNVIVIADRFELGLRIGAGGTGAVHAGMDRQTGEKVAVKILRSDLVADMPQLLERFRLEGDVLRRMNHPNIVKVLATADEGGQHYIVMEYVAGGSLADLLKREPKQPVEHVAALGLEVSDALSRAHHLNIIHRDIKPANILLAEDGTPRLTDFGLARIGNVPGVTAVGTILGTLQYLSPEAVDYQPPDERTDIWSFGVVLHEMLAGQRPFDGDTPSEIISALRNQPVPELEWFRDDVPPALAQLIRRMLMKDRPARIASARVVGAELEAIQRGMQQPVLKGTAEVPNGQPHAQPAPRIRVLLADDHAIVRQGLRTFLEVQDDMEVVGEAANGAEAVEMSNRLKPDVVLLDLVMPQMDGITATEQIVAANPQARVIILTSFGEDSKIFPAIRAGALGYLLKDIPPNDLVKAVREAYQGKVQLNPDVARKLMLAVASPEQPAPAQPAPAQPVDPDALTARERDVLGQIALGLNNREIAAKMMISEKTVKTHVSNILAKLRLDDRTQAAIYAIKHGITADPGGTASS